MSHKDFDKWNEMKKTLNGRPAPLPYPRKREIWWCILGLNIGSEQDGNEISFERPVLVLRRFNIEQFRIIPITSGIRDDDHHMPIVFNGKTNSLIVSQMRSVSIKRFTIRLARLGKKEFDAIMKQVHWLL